jgi:predicted alpha/beta superfamily hydrolase
MRKTKRNTFGFVFCICIVFAATLYSQDSTPNTYDGPKENLHIYLLIGQSNMSGRAPFSKQEAAVIPGCYLLNGKDKWEPARNPLNRYSTIRKGLDMQKMNPGYTFSHNMLKEKKGISLGLIVNAKGGTSIKLWAKGTKFYNEVLRRAAIAQKTGIIKGILWHQGEADRTDAQYLDKLKNLIINLRNDLGIPGLPFVAGQINNVKLINDQIAKLSDTLPFTGFASSAGLEVEETDRWHFDAKGIKILGERYAVEMQKIQSGLETEQKNAENIIIGHHVKMQSKLLEKEMQLSIHIPDNYETSTEHYPVLYTFQTHFEQVSGAIKNLYDYNLTPKIIVVRIDNYEYGYLTPSKIESNPNSGKADLFLQFFKEELFPFMDAKYRTHPYRIVFSNSWGAMFAAYAILAKPDVFNAAIASIPWIPYDKENKFMINNTEKNLTNNTYHNFLYLTMDNETEILQDLESFLDIIKRLPMTGLEWQYHYWPEEDHTSTPYRSVYSGLRALFKDWNQIPEDITLKGLAAVKQHEKDLNNKFGYDIGLSTSALRIAGQQHQKNNIKEAIVLYKYAIEKQPDNAFVYVTLGKAYEENNQLQLAKEAFEKAYELALASSHLQIKWIKNFLDKIKKKVNQ